jgi:hypothetical protein
VFENGFGLLSSILLNLIFVVLQGNSWVSPLVDFRRKDSCEVVAVDESPPIVVCFCVQKHHCKKLQLSFAVI